ncbi:MAG: hypothetical protein K8L99_24525 [Anaerolineae bacterium]|nr:hypothetical protein [Anaerolineae bacterium]
MFNNRRITVLLSGLVLIATLVALFGLPFATFSASSVDAQYEGPNPIDEVGTCGGSPLYQVRLRGGGVNAYTASDFNQVGAIIPDSDRQKYLLCGNSDTRPEGYVSILFPINQKFYVHAEDVADIVCRNLTDPETGLCS